MNKLLLDPAPLRESADFRRLWIGQAFSGFGGQMTVFAVALQVYLLTRSTVAVGVIGLCVAIPTLTITLFGGALGDAYDRRRIVLLTGSGQIVVSALFAVQAFAGWDRLWVLYLLCTVQSTLLAIGVPARRSFMARLLPRHQLAAGAALGTLAMHASATAGPIVAGVVAGSFGLGICYAIDTLSFVAAIYGVARLPAMPPEGGATRPGAGAVLAALRYIRARDVLKGAFLTDLSITLLAAPTALLPAINDVNLGGRPETLGLLVAAPAIGGVLGSLLSGPAARTPRKGRAMLVAAVAWGIAIAAFGLVTVPALAVALLVAAGIADVVSVVLLTTITQTEVDDSHRSRMSAAEFVVGAGGPQLGNLRAGLLGGVLAPGTAAAVGGLSTLLAAGVIAAALPGFVRWKSPEGAVR
ncbi:MFS transporter [Pseudonocardia sp.]|uniref:MFS transporter n=1 Tax=Pseudonocardia sp. TaxID=60912 RepID=UPI003D0CB52D